MLLVIMLHGRFLSVIALTVLGDCVPYITKFLDILNSPFHLSVRKDTKIIHLHPYVQLRGGGCVEKFPLPVANVGADKRPN